MYLFVVSKVSNTKIVMAMIRLGSNNNNKRKIFPIPGVMGSNASVSGVIAYTGGWIYPEYSLARPWSVFRFRQKIYF